VFILKCLDWNNRSQLTILCRRWWPTTLTNASTHDGYGSVNITMQRCKCKCVCDSCWSPLSAWNMTPYFTPDTMVEIGHETKVTRMWADAQRDGRPAEYRWHPLFNAAKFGWRPLLEYRAVTLPRRETRWNKLGCPKLPDQSQPLVGRSSPYLCGHLEEILLLNKFFSDCRHVP